MSDDNPPPATVLEYRRVEPIAAQTRDREVRAAIGAFGTFILFVAFFAAMLWQSSYPQDQRARDVDRWLEVELQRRMYVVDSQKGLAPATPPPPVPTPLVAHVWASRVMTVGDAALVILALFSHRLIRRFDDGKEPRILTPARIWRFMLVLAIVQLLLALACIGLDAWRVFTPDFLFVGWVLIGLLLAEVITRFATGASLPEMLQRHEFAKETRGAALRR